MSQYLIDTHILIWWLEENPKLPQKTRRLLEAPSSAVFVSMITPWEIIIKTSKEKLPGGDEFLTESWRLIEDGLLTLLLPQPADFAALRTLPLQHRDPFDRLLIAQALISGLPLISADKVFAKYDVPVIW